MPRIEYAGKTFNVEATAIVDLANQIIAEYAAQGFNLTLRQLYYQFVSRDAFPAKWADKETGSTNNERSYKKLGDIISDARMAGLIDWEAIIDRTRSLRALNHWKHPADIMQACASQFRIDLWKNQEWRPEVWVEKDAAIGVVENICNKWRVPYFSCRGYTSQSAMWEASQRLLGKARKGTAPFIIHLGDHDPSGVDMSRDVEERVRAFIVHHSPTAARAFQFKRIALNMDQVEQYTPPPNPTKVTDSRAQGYIAKFGHECWELDALEPADVATLIEDEIMPLINLSEWESLVEREEAHKANLAKVASGWDSIIDGLGPSDE